MWPGPPTHRGTNGGIAVPRCHPVARTGLLRRRPEGCRLCLCSPPRLPLSRMGGSGRSRLVRFRGKGTRPPRLPSPRVFPNLSPEPARCRPLRGSAAPREASRCPPVFSSFLSAPRRCRAGPSRAASWRDPREPPCCPPAFPPARSWSLASVSPDGRLRTARVAFEHEMHAAGEAEGAGD